MVLQPDSALPLNIHFIRCKNVCHLACGSVSENGVDKLSCISEYIVSANVFM